MEIFIRKKVTFKSNERGGKSIPEIPALEKKIWQNYSQKATLSKHFSVYYSF